MNLANYITVTRIALIPIFMFFLLYSLPHGKIIAAIIFTLAAGTDGLDGYLARSRCEVTKLGKFLDPLADKLLVSAALISLVGLNIVPSWIAVIIIGRDFSVTLLRAIAASEGIVISASKLGKFKTISQIVAIIALLINGYPFNLINVPIGIISLYVAVVFTLVSGLEYFLRIMVLFSDKKHFDNKT